MQSNSDNRDINAIIPLIGYAEQLSGCAGDTIDFKVSSTLETPYTTELIRIICADPNPAGPGLIEEHIKSSLDNEHPSHYQPFYPGSYGIADLEKQNLTLGSFTFSTIIKPTKTSHQPQTIAAIASVNAKANWSFDIDQKQNLVFCHSDYPQSPFTTQLQVKTGIWQQVFVQYDQNLKTLSFGIRVIGKHATESIEQFSDVALPQTDVSSLSIGAHTITNPKHHFNGKIESPVLFSAALNRNNIFEQNLLCRTDLTCGWNLAKRMSSMHIPGEGTAACELRLVNLPTRAVMNSRWTGEERNWRHKPDHYSAIHFHEDDIYDFNWGTSFQFTIPNNLRSGCYAIKITCGEYEDKIPFFVTAKPNQPAAKICVLASTFTYVIYGNHARPDYTEKWQDHFERRNGYRWNPAVYSDYGLSTYNVHSDGSGICHASHRRPLLNLRSGYITFGDLECSGLRHFQADSHLITWLEQQDIEYDLITDQELQNHGVSILENYEVLVTGSHPEYHTPKMLDALSDYRILGGNLVYLGGNGFYWKIAEHAESSGTLEVRRAEGGIRAWAAEPGEYYQAFDGEYGGLWRRNNRPPQQLAGIGFSAQGKFTGSYYRRSEASYSDEAVNWIFAGVNDDIIGDFGLCGFGAAGFELDRLDTNLGSSENCTILASSENHDDDFVLVPEEQLTHITNCVGVPEKQLIRADMVFQQSETGSKLFATGSITFCGSLLDNNCKNSVSRILENVLRNFSESD